MPHETKIFSVGLPGRARNALTNSTTGSKIGPRCVRPMSVKANEPDWSRSRPNARGWRHAVATLSTAARHPGYFGRLLLQSGSFAFTDIGPSRRGPVFEPVVEFVNEFRARPRKVADWVFVSCGTYESLIYENRSLVPVLQSTGMEVRFVEARDGHNWENWRDRMREGLSWLFPGPLRMVYE